MSFKVLVPQVIAPLSTTCSVAETTIECELRTDMTKRFFLLLHINSLCEE
jgi:hypothetical protein